MIVDNSRRIQDHPLLGPAGSQNRVTFLFDETPITGVEGETIAMALWGAGIKAIRHDLRTSDRRGLFCGIGHCYECRVMVDGIPNVRACLEPVRAGVVVRGKEGES